MSYSYSIGTIALDSTNSIMEFNHMAEMLLIQIVVLLKIVIEGVAVLILALAVIKALRDLGIRKLKMQGEEKLTQIRLDLGVALALSLEFLLAADIAATAVSPTWDALGKLATISAIRTFLNVASLLKAGGRWQRAEGLYTYFFLFPLV